ncbi:1-acylglycerol-3-phosphate O-acyltransferase PNPLA3 isoform X2 [Equus przewalskii]|uniref:1-acylglycerol-3-phosphate O-acyltransferase PNPLA3 isoform X2 n=1 Tax=Equus przewalskii TaxID=9798 RepID=A0ABM2FEQ7_EQUPR|nr:PREDICTED: patatin-like phospholipase domain-containing protein 3 isoform X3 [Equus przewalskii]
MYDPERGWSMSFSGCGFLGFYHVGVTCCLGERAPHLLRDARMFLGASGGALHVVSFLSGMPLELRVQILIKISRSARSRNIGIFHPSFNLDRQIREDLHRHLPGNVHQLISGKICISLTRVSDGENVMVSDFRSKDEVVDALMCSCFIPFLSGLMPPSFRGVVLGEICLRGYLDAVRFLEENGICDRPHLYQNLSSEEPEVLAPLWEHMSLGSAPGVTSPEGEELLDHLRLNIPRWDESILETLSPTLTIALSEALKPQGGYMSKFCNFLLIRVMSYVMLPCTLPLESAIAAVQRLVTWLPDIPDDIQWLQWLTSQICSQVMTRLLPASRSQAPVSSQQPSLQKPEHSGHCWAPHSPADLGTALRTVH